jgi:cytochrome b
LTADRVRVWDAVVRTTHWGVAVAFAAAYVTHGGYLFAHRIAGYVLLALLVVRIAWGFAGPGAARFSSFIAGPRRLLAYLGQVVRGSEPRFIGHNPAGAAMIILLLALLAAVSATGVVLDTPAWRDHRGLQAVHDGLADAIVVCVLLHLAGVAHASWRHRENLVGSMITGRKRPGDAGR